MIEINLRNEKEVMGLASQDGSWGAMLVNRGSFQHKWGVVWF